jgi:hypothetical protein
MNPPKIAGAPTTAPRTTEPPAVAPVPPVAPATLPAAPAVTTAPPPIAAAPAPVTPARITAAPSPVPDRSGLDEEIRLQREAREQIEADATASTAARERIEAERNKIVSAGRLRELRKMGAVAEIPDADLLALAPDVDCDSEAGREQLIAWAQSRPSMFRTSTTRTIEVAEVVTGMPTNDLFGPEQAKRFMDRVVSRGGSRGA